MHHYQHRDLRGRPLCGAVDLVAALSAQIILASSALAGSATVVFGPPVFVSQSVGVARMAVADFNLDNRPDLALIDSNLNISTFINGGSGSFIGSLAALGAQPFDPRIDATDLDGDHLPDIVAVAGDIEFQTFIQQPGGDFTHVPTGIPGEFYFPRFVLGHMNDDTSIDLVTANPQGVHLNDGSGHFETVGQVSFTPVFSQIHPARLNNDELTDVLRIFGVLPATLQVMRNDGDGVLTLSAQYNVPNNTDSAVGDFNADGITDIAMIDYAPANAIVVRLGQPSATLGSPAVFSTGPYPSRIAAGDVNGDGHGDIIVAMSSSNGIAHVRAYLSQGDGTFVLGGSSPIPVNDSGGGGPHILDMAITDFNNDGRTDLLVASVGYGLVLAPNITPMPIGDITGDGVVDVDDLLAVITNWGPCPAPPAACPPDIAPADAPDGVVNVDDLLMVITNWG